MSARAAWRLEELHFGDVHDYRGGMSDWAAAGLGRGGDTAATPTAGDVARVDVPTCSQGDSVGEVRARIRPVCVVTNAEGIALGVVNGRHAEGRDDATPVGDVMEVLPYAKRPSAQLDGIVADLNQAGLEHVLITTPEGRLIGLLSKDDAQQALAAQ